MKHRETIGFTLIELMVAAVILLFCLSGLLATYFQMFMLSDLTRVLTLATNAAQAKIEEIRQQSFDTLLSFNGTQFNITGFNTTDAKGVIYVTEDTANNPLYNLTDLKDVRVEVSFRHRGRVIGEDSDLNGVLDIGEDANNNTYIDSPAESVTLIAK
jgi:prepilin-type N-terminal cleavage/methylation domain-containing protein